MTHYACITIWVNLFLSYWQPLHYSFSSYILYLQSYILIGCTQQVTLIVATVVSFLSCEIVSEQANSIIIARSHVLHN